MRIRKHASKILGIASSFPSSSPPPSQLPEAYVCELNRSPWDLVPLPPLPHSDEYWSADPKEPEQEEGLLGNGIKGGEEPISVTASTGFMRNEQVQEEEEKNMSVKKGKKRNKKKMKKEVGIEANHSATTTVTICKKTDGKQWQCKRPAHHPHTFCHYHLTQLRSYSYSSGHHKISSAGNHGTTRRKRAVMDAVGSDSNYVYYSTFGPWRAKRRGGDSSGSKVAAKHEQVGEEEEKGGSNGAPMIHDDQKNSDEEDVGVEDSEGKKKMDIDKRVPSRSKPKKRRKPVKERSLKSLF